MGTSVLGLDSATKAQNDSSVDGYLMLDDGNVLAEYVDSDVVSTAASLAQPPVDAARAQRSIGVVSTKLNRRSGNRVAHIILNLVLVVLVSLAAAVAVIPRVTGAVPLTVLSGSMLPALRPGDLVVVRPTPADHLHIGDVVTFQPQSGVATLVTHRIIYITHDANGHVVNIQTQGDANNAPDNLLVPDQIMGRVWYSVPFIGHVTNGRNALLAISLVGLGLVAYAVVLFTKKDDEEETPDE